MSSKPFKRIIDLYLGIDPGKSGAVALINTKPLIKELHDCPPNEVLMAQLIKNICKKYPAEEYNIFGAIERVHSMPKQGVSSSFTFGKNYGNWTMALAYAEIPYLLPTPQTWQKGFFQKADGKKASFNTASRMFPTAELQGPKGGTKDGRCDALLIADWRRRQ